VLTVVAYIVYKKKCRLSSGANESADDQNLLSPDVYQGTIPYKNSPYASCPKKIYRFLLAGCWFRSFALVFCLTLLFTMDNGSIKVGQRSGIVILGWPRMTVPRCGWHDACGAVVVNNVPECRVYDSHIDVGQLRATWSLTLPFRAKMCLYLFNRAR